MHAQREARLGARLVMRALASSEKHTSKGARDEASQFQRPKIVHYPHVMLTRPALPVLLEDLKTSRFRNCLTQLNQIASELMCLSISATQFYWNAQVILLKMHPDAQLYESWVNPHVPNYDDKTSIAPMFGYWENCVSCSAIHAWVIRPQTISVKGYNESGVPKEEVMTGMKARLLMHELDHLRGVSMMQQAPSTDFLVAHCALMQQDVWPANFPSAEAYVTPPGHFFDYVSNKVVVPEGLEWYHAATQNQMKFTDKKIGHT